MSNSSTVSGGQAALADQYNNLRKDFLIDAGELLTDSGAANAYVVTCDVQITSLGARQVVKFIAGAANTGASTLRFTNGAALDETDAIKKQHDQALSAGDIQAGSLVILVFDGTNWQFTGMIGEYLSEANTFFGATDISGAEAETLTDGSDANALHLHDVYIGDGSRLTTGTQTTQQDKVITFNVGFVPSAFECIIDLGIVENNTWDNGANSNLQRLAVVVIGNIVSGVLRLQCQNLFGSAAAAPSAWADISPYYLAAQNSSPNYAGATLSSPGLTVSATATGSLQSIVLSGTDLLFNFRGVKNAATNFDLLYGVRNIKIW